MNFISAHGICAACVLETDFAAALITVTQSEFHHDNPLKLSTGQRLFESIPKSGTGHQSIAQVDVAGRPYEFIEFAELMKPYPHRISINQNVVFPFSTVLYLGSALCPPHMLAQRAHDLRRPYSPYR